MARMIDADRLLRELTALSHGQVWPGWTYDGIRLLIERQPTLTQPNEPLTLDELREMDGQPVWVEEVKHWALIDIEKGGQWDGIPFAVWAENGAKFTYNVKSRGLQCYRRPPEGEEEEKHVIEITENL